MDHLWLYAVLVFGIIALPGMDMAFVLASALAGGRAMGFAAVLGFILGGAAHVALSAIGIGLVFQQFPAAFNAMLLAGSAYVAWLGWGLLRSSSAFGDFHSVQRIGAVKTFGRAVLTCMLNPKAYVFMLAVFPQFLKPERGGLVAQASTLWLIGSTAQLLVYGSLALAAAHSRQWLQGSSKWQIAFARVLGVLFIGMAVWRLAMGWHDVGSWRVTT